MKPVRSELAVVVSTPDAAETVAPFLERLEKALAGIAWELVFIDDSEDGPSDVVTQAIDGRANVRCLSQAGLSGMASVCAEGLLATSSACIAVMDTHPHQDEGLLQQMVLLLGESDLDAIIATCADGEQGEARASWRLFGRRKAAGDVPVRPGEFFMMRRNFLEQSLRNMSGKPAKTFNDLLASAPGEVRFQIMPFSIPRRRGGGGRKRPIVTIAENALGRFIPVRLVLFGLVGTIGVAVHFSILGLLHRLYGIDFVSAQIAATFGAMTFNYFLNNALTYGDRRLRGGRLIKGLLSFYLICGAGVLVNVYAAHHVFGLGVGWVLAGLTGAAISSLWNYAATATITWRERAAATIRQDGALPRLGGASTGLSVGG